MWTDFLALPSGGRINCTHLMRFRAHQTSCGCGSIVRKHKSKEGTSGLSWLSQRKGVKEPVDQNLGRTMRVEHPAPPSTNHLGLIVNTWTVERPLSETPELLLIVLQFLKRSSMTCILTVLTMTCESMRYLRSRSRLGKLFVVTVLQIDCRGCFVLFFFFPLG